MRIAYILTIIGLIIVVSSSYSATKIYSLSHFHFAIKHAIFCIAAIGSMRFFSNKINWIPKLGQIFWIASMCGLVYVLLFGHAAKGASRWINFFGITLQPSEFVKIGAMIEGIKYVEKNWNKFAFIYLAPIALLLLQPDLGSSIILLALATAQIIVKRFNIKYISLGITALVLLILCAYFSLEHVRTRIDLFLHPTADIFGAGYQRYKSFLVMQNGGLFGRGFGKGIIKDVLPDAHTDYVFAVIVEEFGIIGGLFVISLFITLGLRVLKLLSNDANTKMIQYSFLICILSQAWLNIASTLSLIPAKGLTLPLISYGGSGMLMQGIAFGILLASCRSVPKMYPNAR